MDGGSGTYGGNGEAWRGAVSPATRYAESGGASLTWENLTAVLPGGGGRATKKLVQGLYGYAVPGRVVAIMGPSGSGKSTLLDSLSGTYTPPTRSRSFRPFVFLASRAHAEDSIRPCSYVHLWTIWINLYLRTVSLSSANDLSSNQNQLFEH